MRIHKKLRIFVLLALLGLGYFLYKEQDYKNSLSRVVDASKKGQIQEIAVEKGMSVAGVVKLLEEKRLVVQGQSLLRYLKEHHLDTQIQAGSYYIDPSFTIAEITDILIGKVDPSMIRVTIPEGYTIRDIGTLLEKKHLTTASAFVECVTNSCLSRAKYSFLPQRPNIEGYLFPDTYYVQTHAYTDDKFFGQLLDNFKKRVTVGLSEELASSDHTLDEVVIMASIIEKESRPKDDQNIVAGILWKRLAQGVQLATDATNRYVMDDPTAPILMKDLVSDNPYNMRRIRGLPPTAISNPGLAALKATLLPKSSSYWYYLHDAEGQIHFADTENEHEQNKSLYLR